MHDWLRLRCPDCVRVLHAEGGLIVCPSCGRRFEVRNGVVLLLPKTIEQEAIKQREKDGWEKLAPHDDAEQWNAHLLNLPYIEEPADGPQHYREAARQFDLAAEFLQPVAGKRGLDLGGSVGWAAYRFSCLGAEMVLTDFNESTVSGLGAAQVYLEAGARFDRICADAESLPLADGQFDFVFSSAFLHHLPHPDRAVGHAARVLKAGGYFIATNESFRPFWMSRERAIARCPLSLHHIEEGINEQVFPQRAYRKWFRAAGLTCRIVNPRWEAVRPGAIDWGARLKEKTYQPEILTNRAGHRGTGGALARFLLRHRLWRPLTAPLLFRLIRPSLLSGTQKFRILIGQKISAVTSEDDG